MGQPLPIAQAKPIPYVELSQKLGEMNQEGAYILISLSGKMALWAQDMMKKAGFKNVQSLKGGANAWGKETDQTLQ